MTCISAMNVRLWDTWDHYTIYARIQEGEERTKKWTGCHAKRNTTAIRNISPRWQGHQGRLTRWNSNQVSPEVKLCPRYHSSHPKLLLKARPNTTQHRVVTWNQKRTQKKTRVNRPPGSCVPKGSFVPADVRLRKNDDLPGSILPIIGIGSPWINLTLRGCLNRHTT